MKISYEFLEKILTQKPEAILLTHIFTKLTSLRGIHPVFKYIFINW